jgi:hypothetical protein
MFRKFALLRQQEVAPGLSASTMGALRTEESPRLATYLPLATYLHRLATYLPLATYLHHPEEPLQSESCRLP